MAPRAESEFYPNMSNINHISKVFYDFYHFINGDNKFEDHKFNFYPDQSMFPKFSVNND